jgi:methylmalonyl-CoA mutase cobalamin-binding domain/chain
MEKVFGRHRAVIQAIEGVYGKEAGADPKAARAKAMVAAFREAHGGAPRIMVAKMGQDGHDRGQKVISSAFADLGFQVEIGPLFQTPAEAADEAIKAGVHVGRRLVPGRRALDPGAGAESRAGQARPLRHRVVVGGVIPPQDFQALLGRRRRQHLPARHGHRRSGHRGAGEAEHPARLQPGHGGLVGRAGYFFRPNNPRFVFERSKATSSGKPWRASMSFCRALAAIRWPGNRVSTAQPSAGTVSERLSAAR